MVEFLFYQYRAIPAFNLSWTEKSQKNSLTVIMINHGQVKRGFVFLVNPRSLGYSRVSSYTYVSRVRTSQPQRDFEPNMGEKSGDILTDVFCY